MFKYCPIGKFFLSMAAIIILNSCVVHNKIDSFYSIPAVTYLRESPNYDCQVVTELYNADAVKILENNGDGWWRVQSLRNQKIGWIQPELLSDQPIIAKHYYITADGLPLRNAPSQDVMSRHLLNQGDKVQKIAGNDGWWRVLVEKDKSLGWIPAALVSEKPPEPSGTATAHRDASDRTERNSAQTPPSSKPDYHYVVSESLNLHILPLSSSRVVKVLHLNDKVEKLSHSGSQWMKVRYPGTGAEGWAATRCLKDAPVTKKTQIVTTKNKSRKKSPSPKPIIQDPFESETLEPEGM